MGIIRRIAVCAILLFSASDFGSVSICFGDAQQILKGLKSQKDQEAVDLKKQEQRKLLRESSGKKLPTPNEIRKYVPDVVDFLAKQIGDKRDSPEMQRLASDLDKSLAGHGSLYQSIPTARSLNAVVVDHLKFTEGHDLPSSQKLSALKEKTREESKKVALALMKDKKIDPLGRYLERLKTIETPIPKKQCPVSNSFVTKNDVPLNQLGSVMDVLFVDGELPFDPSQTIGKKVLVIPYGSEKARILSGLFGRMGIPCLPYRVRVSGDQIQYFVGAIAYSNFDNSQNGEGKLDATVQAWLYQSSNQRGG